MHMRSTSSRRALRSSSPCRFSLSNLFRSDSVCIKRPSRLLDAADISSCSLRIKSQVRFVSSRIDVIELICDTSDAALASAASASALALAAFCPAIRRASVVRPILAEVVADASRSVKLTCVMAAACSSASFNDRLSFNISAIFSFANSEAYFLPDLSLLIRKASYCSSFSFALSIIKFKRRLLKGRTSSWGNDIPSSAIFRFRGIPPSDLTS
mmetsp:Transcript_12360/g.14553  ORF Transcript_12360/g.14553 Transcript_12360/m.14553 type:complete len:213 (+) Transcript_12360:1035-1673(+)